MMRLSILYFIFLLSSYWSWSQDPIELEKFGAYKSGNSVLLDWTIRPGGTCNGIEIQRSNGSEDFYKIGEVLGICGNPETAKSYTFNDLNPLPNQVNYYRLLLGGFQLSEIASIEFINVDALAYYMQFFPLEQKVKIHFKNTIGKVANISFYDATGTQFLNQYTAFDFFEIDINQLKKGLIFFTIYSESSNENIHGKLYFP